MLRKFGIAAVIVFCIAGGGYAVAAVVSEPTIGTNVSCATATVSTPDHTVGVDGTDVHTISGTQSSASHCETQTYTIPAAQTVTQTVTSTPTQTTTTSTTPTSTTTSSSTTSTTTSAPPPPPPAGLVPCPLTHAAGADPVNSCWAQHTGVFGSTGVTEAQIKAGAAGFTKHNGELDIAQPNTTIDHMWVNGCISIANGANNTVIKNSLVTSGGGCSGDDAGGSANNTGQGAKIAKNTLIEDTTIDGGTTSTGTNSAGLTLDAGKALRINISGFTRAILSDSNTAANPALFQDNYVHGFSGCVHDDGTWFDSSSYVTFEHGYVLMGDPAGSGCTTAALSGGADFGPQDHITYDASYADGADGENIHTGCGSTQMTITNNALDNAAAKNGSDGGYGSLAGNTWAGNYSVDHASGAKGAAWGPFGNGC